MVDVTLSEWLLVVWVSGMASSMSQSLMKVSVDPVMTAVVHRPLNRSRRYDHVCVADGIKATTAEFTVDAVPALA